MFKATKANILIALAASFSLPACSTSNEADDSSHQAPEMTSTSDSDQGVKERSDERASREGIILPSGSMTKIDMPQRSRSTRSSTLTVEAVGPDVASVSASGASAYADRINAIIDTVFVHVDQARSTEPTTQAEGTSTWNIQHDGVSTQLVVEDLGENRHEIAFTETRGLIAMSGIVEVDAEGEHSFYELSLSVLTEQGEQIALDVSMMNAGEFRVLDYDFVQAQGFNAEVATTRYWDLGESEGQIEHDLISSIDRPRVGRVQVRWNENGGRSDAIETGNPDALVIGAEAVFTTSCWDARASVVFDGVYSEASASAYALARGDIGDCAVSLEGDDSTEYGESMEGPDWSTDLEEAEEFSDYGAFPTPYNDPLFEEDEG